ncbi:MAG: hypothetical protein DRR16_23215 [Candidatus Parabeggiatoa sp. nov. 3]|jgi:hypothetical protein|nr:MAG: hypothetical protein DRR00_18780 [Gammaproteobacteria bacterium]RKZ60735.1 MAG: hypothetical protein DRQ99_21620 [Gammaproteobacteria bacterium]RKZ80824.1 MAG: hypothetical protein DRR16_23215 [Gammaproteobacteria bacterium]HEW97089.1 hypothetical protein [Beggiatoa sp.]
MDKYAVVRSHKRKKPVWVNGGRGKMTTLHVPTVIREEAYKIAVVLDNVSDFKDRIEEIKKILANS